MDWRDQIPTFVLQSLPAEEVGEARHIEQLVYSLHTYTRDFRSALLLFDNSLNIANANPQHEDDIRSWMFIAARDGAMTIYHFGKVLNLIRSSMGPTPAFRAKVATDELRQCAKDFEAAFPLFQKMRHAIAHSGEMLQIEKQRSHAISGEIDIPGLIKGTVHQVTLSSNLMNREFGHTFEGAYVTYSVSGKTLETLTSIKNRVYEAFSAVILRR